MPGEATNVRGPCSSCGAQLATDQRYCVECGQRVGPPMALPYALPATAGAVAPTATGGWMAALPVPLQTLSAFAALALGFGFVVGTAISPNLGGTIAAQSPTVVAQAPPAPQTPAHSGNRRRRRRGHGAGFVGTGGELRPDHDLIGRRWGQRWRRWRRQEKEEEAKAAADRL